MPPAFAPIPVVGDCSHVLRIGAKPTIWNEAMPHLGCMVRNGNAIVRTLLLNPNVRAVGTIRYVKVNADEKVNSFQLTPSIMSFLTVAISNCFGITTIIVRFANTNTMSNREVNVDHEKPGES